MTSSKPKNGDLIRANRSPVSSDNIYPIGIAYFVFCIAQMKSHCLSALFRFGRFSQSYGETI